MRSLITLLLLCCSFITFGHNGTYEKLCEVNKCWTEQKDINNRLLSMQTGLDERGWIKLHLSLVEKTLRARNTENLTTAQKQNRATCLDHLHQYWQAGQFPINEDYSYRTPIFIDKHNNFCAVGYLVKTSGHEDISRMIASKTNLAYVRQMHYPELNAWANDNGFTVDELAWIQPGYPSSCYAAKMGNGTNGEVNELFYDDQSKELFVGGQFSKVDDNITTNNIAYVTENGGTYTWHNMGAGVTGDVLAIAKFDNKIFVAGNISSTGIVNHNISYWESGMWHDAGCGTGLVTDLVVYNNELYGCGNFQVCAASTPVNFAKWTSSGWQPIPGIEGRVNTMELWNNGIVLGGAFKYNGADVNVIQWTPSLPGSFQPYANAIENEVMDLQAFKGELYAATKFTSSADMELLKKLSSNQWVTEPTNLAPAMGGDFSLNTLCADDNNLTAGGKFLGGITIGSFVVNCRTIKGSADWFAVNDAINKMIICDGKIIAGGVFHHDVSDPNTALNNIGYRKEHGTGIPGPKENAGIAIYPNPAGNNLAIQGLAGNASYNIYNMQGQKVLAGATAKDVNISMLPAGNYFIRMQDNKINTNIQFVKE